ELGPDAADHLTHRGRVGHVGFVEAGLTARFVRQALSFFRRARESRIGTAEMIDDDVGAFTCQPDGDRPADAARRARDQSNLSFEPATEIGHVLARFWREAKDA